MTENPTGSNPGLTEVKRVVDRLEDDVREIKNAIRGTEFGERGIITRIESTEREQRDLKKVVEGFETAEQQREDARIAREKKRDRFQTIIYTLLTTIIGGVATSLIVLYLNSGIGA